jgi:N-acetylneuraminic acid mutarotase
MLSGTRSLAGETGLAIRRCWLILVLLALCSIQAHAFSGAWTRKADVPTPRVGAGASVIGDSIYVLGGLGVGLVEVAANEVYNPSTDSWEGKKPLPTGRSWPASAVVDGLVYCIGGGYPIFRNAVEAYDPATNTWTTETAMPTARFGATASVVNGVIYVIGGYPYLRTCEAYDPNTNTWTTKKERPESGGVFAATVHDGIIYTFGGGSVENYLPYSTVYAYNPQTDTWTKKADMPTSRFGLQTYLVDGKIYAIGGTNQLNIALATVEVYDPASDTWTAKSDMPGRFMFFAGAVVNGKIYVIGGTPDMSSGGFEVWEYDPAFHTDIAAGTVSGTWTLAGSPYYINGEISVPNDSTLTIEPNVEVAFMGHYKLNVQGRILAIGAQTDSIRFTAADQGAGWHGVRFINTPSANDTSKLFYCSFKYGKANTGSGDDRCGGAMMIRAFDKVVVSNCLFASNLQSGAGWSPIEAGGAMYFEDASPQITQSTFANNTGSKGSAVVCENSSHAAISHSVFVSNRGAYGPVVCDGVGSPTVSDNIISDNFAGQGGGGILLGNGSTPRIENNVIVRNQAPPGGGGIGCWTLGNAVMINNTIAYNYGQLGGGIFCAYDSDPILINNIVYGNSATSGKQLYIEDNPSDPTVVSCDIEGGKDGIGGPAAGTYYTGLYENNIDAYPLFVDTASGNYRLLDTSPCIGAGADSMEIAAVWYRAPANDIEGRARPSPTGTRPDIGAYESLRGDPVEGVGHEATLPLTSVLYQNYPNPFNPTTVIRYQLPAAGDVKLTMYDVLGRELRVLVDERRDAGVHEVTFDAVGLAGGAYFYRMRVRPLDSAVGRDSKSGTGTFVQTRTLLLLR